MNRLGEDNGTALIWFVSLVALVAALALVLVSAVDQFLLARNLTDFAEQFALSCKALLLINPGQDIALSSSKLAATLKLSGLWIQSANLEQGETVRIVVCSNWSSPVDLISAARTICEQALAR